MSGLIGFSHEVLGYISNLIRELDYVKRQFGCQCVCHAASKQTEPYCLELGFLCADWPLTKKKLDSAVSLSKQHYGTEAQNMGKLSTSFLYGSTTRWLGTGSTLPCGLKLKHL
jgi:hypothetical protein